MTRLTAKANLVRSRPGTLDRVQHDGPRRLEESAPVALIGFQVVAFSPFVPGFDEDELLVLLEAEFAKASTSLWLDRFRTAGVPCAPINSYSQVLSDPQVEHMQWVQPLELPNGVKTRTFAGPVRLCGEGLPVRLRPPALGEHNDEVLGPLRRARQLGVAKQ